MVDDFLRDRVFQPIADWYGKRYENTSFSLASAMFLLSILSVALCLGASGFPRTFLGLLIVALLVYLLNSTATHFEAENDRYLRTVAQGISYVNPYRVNSVYLVIRIMPLAVSGTQIEGAVIAVSEGRLWALFIPLIGLFFSAGYYFAACAPDKVPPGCKRI